jgi:hypothetical protein
MVTKWARWRALAGTIMRGESISSADNLSVQCFRAEDAKLLKHRVDIAGHNIKSLCTLESTTH